MRKDDTAIAAVVTAITLVAGLFLHQGESASWGIVLPGLAGVLLAWRRRWPVAVLVAVLVLTLAYWLAGFPGGPVWLPLTVAFFTAHYEGHRLAAVLTLAAGWIAFAFVSPLARGEDITLVDAGGLASWLLVLLAAAEVIRSRRISRAATARRQAGEERLRIARELHDVLAHDISLINVQAGVALHLIDERPEQAREALAAIKHASKDALGELRSVLETLRAEGPAPLTPTAGLDRLGEVVTGAAAAGLRVETSVEGEAEPLPAALDLAAFRIVQEAVTNVIRHADTAHAAVRLRYGDGALEVEVSDEGRGGSANGHGNGLAGMAERAAALGGTLDAGPRPGGGFRVHATLPRDAGPKPRASFAPQANTPSDTSPQGEASP